MSPEAFIVHFVHPSHRDMIRDEIASIPLQAAPGLVREFELHGLFADGSDGWFAVRYTVEGDAAGVARRALGVSQNITLEYRMQRALQATGEFYRVLIEQSLCPICIVDRLGRLTYANPLLEQMMHSAPGALTGRRAFSFVQPADRPAILNQARDYLMGRASETRFEARVRTGDNVIIDILASTARFLHAERPAHLVFFVDISEQRESRRQLEHLNQTLAMVTAGNELLIRASSEDELLREMCRIVVQVGGRTTAWIGYKDHGPRKAVKPVAHFGAGKDYVAAVDASWADVERGHGPTGTALRTGITQITRDFRNNPAMKPWRESAALYGFQASVALPLRDESGVFGVFTIYSGTAESFLPDEMALLERLAEDLSYGITTRRTAAAHEQDARRHEATLIATIEALGAMIHQRDPYTAGHQRSVARLASAIATAMGMTKDHVRGIHLGSLVHDIGKIKIPSEILTNPGKLTELERLIIRTHPQVGHDIVKGVDFPWPIAQMILQHHERLDGSGYPNGLKGEEILIESRILAVADVVDAMTTRRPYRDALGIEVALAEIEKRKGCWFDPVVVDMCLRLFREEGFTFE